MPVNFNEPLSMLQRITEDFEYYAILDRAAAAETIEEQVALVAAFSGCSGITKTLGHLFFSTSLTKVNF